MVENPLSQSAVDTGRVRAILASLERQGYREEKEKRITRYNSHDFISWDL